MPPTGPGLDVVLSKEDVAGNEIPKAELTLRSVDGYDLSGVVVKQNGVAVDVRLSADKTAIAFDTVENYKSLITNLPAGDYELKETVTPKKYLTADAIYFTLRNDGSAARGSTVIAAGSPIVMIDKADPTYETPVPATGEQTSITTMAGIVVLLFAASLTGYGIFRAKKKKE